MLVVRSEEHDGRLRRYYHITESGLKRIKDFMDEWKDLMEIYSFIERGI
jgi:PadR family transcriptional regulator PadR